MAVGEMERRGIVGNAGLYYDLARCLCSAGRCHEALKQVGVFYICHTCLFTVVLLSFIYLHFKVSSAIFATKVSF